METTEMLNNVSLNQPLYLYRQPMFSLTVSTVLIVENGVVLINNNNIYRFPGGVVRAGEETVQFAAVRYVKEQTGILLKKDALIPVDFRSDPERSKEKNAVDIGFVCITHDISPDSMEKCTKWKEVNFEDNCLMGKADFYMDHEILLERAIEVAKLMK